MSDKPLDAEALDALEALYDAATPGEWVRADGLCIGEEIRGVIEAGFDNSCDWYVEMAPEDTALIVAMHNALPDVIALARDGLRWRERHPQIGLTPDDVRDMDFIDGQWQLRGVTATPVEPKAGEASDA